MNDSNISAGRPAHHQYVIQEGDTADGIAFDLLYPGGQELAHPDEVAFIEAQYIDGKLRPGQEIELPGEATLPANRKPR